MSCSLDVLRCHRRGPGHVLCRQSPERHALKQMTSFFGEKTRDRSQAPVLVRLVEFSGLNTVTMQICAKSLKRRGIASRQVNVRRMVVTGTTIFVGIFNGRMACLNSLLREWDIAAGDRVQVRFLADLHDEPWLIAGW